MQSGSPEITGECCNAPSTSLLHFRFVGELVEWFKFMVDWGSGDGVSLSTRLKTMAGSLFQFCILVQILGLLWWIKLESHMMASGSLIHSYSRWLQSLSFTQDLKVFSLPNISLLCIDESYVSYKPERVILWVLTGSSSSGFSTGRGRRWVLRDNLRLEASVSCARYLRLLQGWYMKLVILSGSALCKETVRREKESSRKPVSKRLQNLNMGNLMPIWGLHGSVLNRRFWIADAIERFLITKKT